MVLGDIMKCYKKIISLLTAAVLAVSLFSVPAFAEETQIPDSYYAAEISGEYKANYDKLRAAIMNFEPTFEMQYSRSKAETDFVFKAMDLFVNYDTYTYNVSEIQAVASRNKLTFTMTYDTDKETYDAGIAAADKAYEELAKTFGKKDNTATKVKKIHDYIATAANYSIESPESDNVYGVFVTGLAKCDGYARAFNFFAEKAGIDSVLSMGLPVVKKDDIGHAWNKVKIGDSWYVIDITNNDTDDTLGFITYDYFMVSDSEYGRGFEEIDDEYITEPQALKDNNSYYRQKKLSVKTSAEAIALIQKQAEAEKAAPFIVSVQLQSDAEYKKFVTALNSDSKIFTDSVKIRGAILESHSTANKVTRTVHIAVHNLIK
jgi:hypothetical protein